MPASANVACPPSGAERWVHEAAMHWCTPTLGPATYVWEISVDGEVVSSEQTSTNDLNLVAPSDMADVTLRVADSAQPELWSLPSQVGHVRISWDYDSDGDVDGDDFMAFRAEILEGMPAGAFLLFRAAWMDQ